MISNSNVIFNVKNIIILWSLSLDFIWGTNLFRWSENKNKGPNQASGDWLGSRMRDGKQWDYPSDDQRQRL